jgi:hypothetical protein
VVGFEDVAISFWGVGGEAREGVVAGLGGMVWEGGRGKGAKIKGD